MVLADVFAPAHSLAARRAYQISTVLAGSALIALSAQLSIDLPFSPVPITGQTFGVLLVAMLLGRVRGTFAILSYLAEGASGLPVFAAGAAGPFYLLGPTGGYLLGFVPAAYLCGWLSEQGWDRNVVLTAAAMALGSIVILLFGAARLAGFVGIDVAAALGIVPFVIGDIVKVAAAALALPALRKFV